MYVETESAYRILRKHFGRRSNNKRIWCWQARLKMDWKEIGLTIHVIPAHIFLERVRKAKFRDRIAIYHRCIVIIGAYLPNDQNAEISNVIAPNETYKHWEDIILCYNHSGLHYAIKNK
jgi:hypothetical protein